MKIETRKGIFDVCYHKAAEGLTLQTGRVKLGGLWKDNAKNKAVQSKGTRTHHSHTDTIHPFLFTNTPK